MHEENWNRGGNRDVPVSSNEDGLLTLVCTEVLPPRIGKPWLCGYIAIRLEKDMIEYREKNDTHMEVVNSSSE